MSRTTDELRALVNPQVYLGQLFQARQTIEERISGALVERDLFENNPEVEESRREATLEALDAQLKNLDWQYDDVVRRISDMEKDSSKITPVYPRPQAPDLQEEENKTDPA